MNKIKTTCVVCNKTFEYKDYKRKCCSSECLSKYRKNLTTKQHSINAEELITKVENYLIYNYENDKIIKTLKECLDDLHIAPKTWYKYSKSIGIGYNDLLEKNNIKSAYSKFQSNINQIIIKYFGNTELIFEKKFEDCVNPKTNYPLRFDIYIPSKNIIIECDGKAHTDKDNYYNVLTLRSGYTPSYETDVIKDNYCNDKGIKMIRIPYKRKVTEKYVLSFIEEYL